MIPLEESQSVNLSELRPASWLRDLEVGKTEECEKFLSAGKLSLAELQGLPDPSELVRPSLTPGVPTK